MEIIIQPGAGDASELAARIIQREVEGDPQSVLGLATGRTMEPVYARLAHWCRQGELDFSRCRTFNLDEYVGLPGRHENSYRYFMNERLFRHVNIDWKQTHLPDGVASDLEAECARYEQLIRKTGGVDLQLLGIGLSGHIGFNEPLSAFGSRTRVVALAPETLKQNAPLFAEPQQMPRQAITMGLGTILDSRRCVLLATGAAKAGIVAATVEGAVTGMVPASVLQWHPDCVIVLDEAAASGLRKTEYYQWMYKSEPKWDWLRQFAALREQPSRPVVPSQLRMEPAA